jgi:Mce-associated membrane protein
VTEQTPPAGPDGASLTPEEWDAVRRLRGERQAAAGLPEPEPSPAPGSPEPEPGPVVAEPAWVDEPAAVAEPLAPVSPPPPPDAVADPVAPVATTDTSLEAEAPAWGGGHRSRRPRTPVAVPALTALLVLAVAAAVLAALVGLKVSARHDRDRASTAAMSAATTGVATVLSYNYRSLDHDFAAAEALLTPSFRKAYDATTAKAVQPLAAKYKAVSTAQVSAAGVISASTSRATVLVFVSQTVTNSQLSAPRLDRSRIQVELVRAHGTWLINKLTPV